MKSNRNVGAYGRVRRKRFAVQDIARGVLPIFELQPLERRLFLTATPSISGAASVNEGSAFSLALASNSTTTVNHWSIDWGDGGAVQSVSGNPSSILHTYADGPTSRAISASVTDSDGTFAASSALVTVNNVAPTLWMNSCGPSVEGSSSTFSLGASDPGQDTITKWTVDWGDGSAIQTLGGGNFLYQNYHTYADNGNYTVTATAFDEDSPTTGYSQTFTVAVADVPPSLWVSRAATANEGSAYALNLAWADPGADTVTGWSINWGDGTTSTAAGTASSITHTYADGPNDYTISATATNEDGTFTAATNLDSSFGGGRVLTDFGSINDVGQAAAVQPDGKVIAVGTSNGNFALSRYNTDGTLDSGFGDFVSGTSGPRTGKTTTDFGSSEQALGVVVQPDPNNPSNVQYIYVAGSSNGSFALARYTAAGVLDTNFGTSGKVTTPVGTSSAYGQSVALQPDGKIVVAGYAYNTTTGQDFALVRYTTTGLLDSSFGSGGKVTTPFGTTASDAGYGIKIQSDGKILVAGTSSSSFALARYNADGTPDNGFGTSGKVTTPVGSFGYGYSVGLQSDGKVIVGGYDYNTGTSSYDFVLARYTTAGALDTSFGTSGIATTDMGGNSTDYGRAIAVAPDDKIYLAGYTYGSGSGSKFAIAKFNANGTIDTSFGLSGKIVTGMSVAPAVGNSSQANGILVRPDGRVILVGQANGNLAVANYDFALAAYHPTDAVHVSNVAPTLWMYPSGALVEGSSVMFGLSASDPGQDTITKWTVDWGDGSAIQTLGGGSYQYPYHTYADNGSYTVTATAFDEDSPTTGYSQTLTVAVADVPPSLWVSRAATANEGSAYALNLAWADPGADTVTGWSINWGDGTTSTAAGTASSITHTYADGPNDYTISATATNEDGTFTAATNLDSSFGGGRVLTDFGSINDVGQAAAVQPDGKVIAVGTSNGNFALSRYNTDGTLDSGFGDFVSGTSGPRTGKTTTDFGSSEQALGVVVQPDPNNPSNVQYIYVAGSSNGSFALARYTAAGVLDTNFGTSGKVTTPVGTSSAYGQSVALQPDGKIVVAGYAYNTTTGQDFALVRYTTTGLLDSSFGSGGKVTTPFGTTASDAGYGIKIQSDGKILVAGTSSSSFALARYNADGTPDNGFGTSGKVTTPVGSFGYGYSVGLQSDGKVIVGGYDYNTGTSSYDFVLARYTTAGALDTSFGTSGIATTDMGGNSTDYGRAIAVAPDDKIYLAGYTYGSGSGSKFAIAKFNANGTIDTSFGLSGKIVTGMSVAPAVGNSSQANGILVRPDGRVILVGQANGNLAVANYDFALAAYHPTDAVHVSNVAPTLWMYPSGALVEGSSVMFGLSASDPGQDTITKWTVDWGDGSAIQTLGGGSYQYPYHTYADNGSYTVTATAFDEDSPTTGYSQTLTVAVADVPPSLWVSRAATANEGSAYALNLAWADPGADTVTGWSINWGDGTTSTAAGTASSITHTYADGPNDYTISATATNEDGTFTAATNLDSSFGGGRVLTDFGSINDVGQAAAVQPDGKVIAVGTSNGNFALSRYNTNGVLDNSFGGNSTGKLTTDFGASDSATSVTVQADPGNPSGPPLYIYVAGSSGGNFALARYTAAGILDTTFNSTGKVTTLIGSSAYGQSVAVQADGKVVVSGYDYGGSTSNDFALVRYTTSGALDNTFGTGGKVTTDFGSSASDQVYSVQTQADPNNSSVAKYIYVAGSSGGKFALARYNASDGSLDSTFGTGGRVTTTLGSYNYATAYSLGFQSVGANAGKIIVGGYDYNGSGYDFVLARYTTAGVLDSTFGTSGVATTDMGGGSDYGRSIAVTADDSIFLAGNSYTVGQYMSTASNFAIAKYTPAGALDASFGNAGKVVSGMGVAGSQANGILVRPDGRVILVGQANGNLAVANYDFALAAYHPTDAVHVSNVAPTLIASGASSVPAGTPYTLNLAASDPGDDHISSAEVNWGDGIWVSINPNLTSPSHIFSSGVTAATVTARVSDEDGGPYLSNPINIQVLTLTAPTNLTTTSITDSQITLSWTDNSDGEQSFEIQRATSASGPWTVLTAAPANASTYAVGGLSEGTHYYFQIRAHNAYADSPWGAVDAFTTPHAPTTLTATANVDGTISLSWVDNSSTEDGFVIERASDGVTFDESWSADADETSFVNYTGNVGTTYTYRVRATLGASRSTASNSAAAACTYVAPTISASSGGAADEGSDFTLNLSTSDPDRIDEWTVNWGDSTDPETFSGEPLSEAHTYLDSGTYSVAVSATDGYTTFSASAVSATISNVAPTVTAYGPLNSVEGTPITFYSTLTDPAGDKDPITYAWSVTKNGSSFAPPSGTVTNAANLSFNPIDNGTYVATLSVDDGDGGTASTSKTTTVANGDRTVYLDGPDTVAANAPYSISLGISADSNNEPITGYTIDWGDGHTSTAGANDTSATHPVATGYGQGLRGYTITVTATDADGGSYVAKHYVQVSYYNDFENADSNGWSGGAITMQRYSANHLLGPVAGSATLDFPNMPHHTLVSGSLSFFALNKWDSTDVFEVRSGGPNGPLIASCTGIDTNNSGAKIDGEDFLPPNDPGGTLSTFSSFGYDGGPYSLSFSFLNSDDDVKLYFDEQGQDGAEKFDIDNVSVSVDRVGALGQAVNLAVNGAAEDPVPTPNELDPGAFIPLSDDPSTPSFVQMALSVPGLQNGDTVTLRLTGGADKVQVWSQASNTSPSDQILGGSTSQKTWVQGTDSIPSALWVMGVTASSAAEVKLELTVNGTAYSYPSSSTSRTSATDTVLATVGGVDLDVDGDNTNGLEAPDRSQDEENIENAGTAPGKIAIVNDDDTDNDGIPDFADGFDLNGDIDSDDQTIGERFVPVVLSVSGGIDLSSATFKIAYSGSDPSFVIRRNNRGNANSYTYLLPDAGSLRLWLKDGGDVRDKRSIVDGGDWIKPEEVLTAEDLGFTNSINVVTLYAEAVKPSNALADQKITVTVTPGTGLTPSADDTVGITSIAPHIEYVTRDGQSGGYLTADSVEPSHPTPDVTLTINSAQIDSNGDLVMEVSGSVHDALSETTDNPSERLQTLFFSVNGVKFDEIDDLSVQTNQDSGDDWSPYPFDVAFTRTLRVPPTAGDSIVIRAETSENAAGNMGWADAGVDLSWVPASGSSSGTGSNPTGGGAEWIGDSSDQTKYVPAVSGFETLGKSETGAFDPAMVRIVGLPEELADKVELDLNGDEQIIKPFESAFSALDTPGETPPGALHDDKNYYVVYGNDKAHRKILVATMDSVPTDLSIVQPDNISGAGYGKVKFSLSVKSESGTIKATQVQVMPENFGPAASNENTAPSWTTDQMLSWFETLYGQAGLQVLQYYQQGQNLITSNHFTSNKTLFNWAIGGKTWDGSWFFRTDNKVEIRVEQNLDPISAAKALFEGLQWAMGKPSFRNQIPLDGDHFQILLDSYRQTGADAVAIGKAAGEAYLAGIQIASTPASVVVGFNDLVQGNYGQAAINLLPLLAPVLLKLGKTAFKITLADGKFFTISAGVSRALGEVESLPTLEERIAHIEHAVAAEGGKLSPEARLAIVKSKYIQPLVKSGENTSATLARNLEAAGVVKPGEIFQAHHDLPQFYRDKFASYGLDIDKAEYGRWVQEGWHQSFTNSFQAAWKAFFDAEPGRILSTGGGYTKNDILSKMGRLRVDPRFGQFKPIH